MTTIPIENMTMGMTTIIALFSISFGVYQYFAKRKSEKCAQEKAEIERLKAEEEKIAAVKIAAETAAKAQGREEGNILTQLGAANKGICDIQINMRRMEEKSEQRQLEVTRQVAVVSERVAVVEGTAKSAHHRIDSLEETVKAVKNSRK